MPHTSATTSPAISRYGDFLEGVYNRRSVSSDGKFPPTPSKTFVNLAVVEHASQIHDLEEVRKNMLHGRVDKLLEGKTLIEITDILKPQDNGNPISLVFVEGPPGIGKSTLAWELCRKWDRKQYDLAVLLRLREREVQQIENIADLFPHIDQSLRQSVAKQVLSKEGKGVLFILDGYDELPIGSRYLGLLFKLLKGEVLPKCSTLVTSRPSATEDLYMACSPQIQRHVEILGFTQESVKDYAASIFFAETELKEFLHYVSASESPAINSLMYIPLNAAIIVHIYRDNRLRDCPLPKTMTQVYLQLCLTLLKRSIMSTNPLSRSNLNSFSDLPSIFYDDFKKLARLAYEQFEKHNVVFYSCDVMVHFGFLDSVPALYGGGGVSYNFLHLTLQEFLAAYHITQLSSGIDVFKRHSEDRRWEVVWRFVSGLTGFQYFMGYVKCGAFLSMSEDVEDLGIKKLLLHCLFEGQFMLDYMAVLGRNKLFGSVASPLDRYALGYCIANCSSTTSWKVCMEDGSGESFMWGLNSNNCGNGIVRYLEMSGVFPTCLGSYPSNILSSIIHLSIDDISNDTSVVLVEVLPLMNSLMSLHLDTEMAPNLIHAISKTNITTLTLTFHEHCNILFFLQSLIASQLQELTIKSVGGASTKPLCDVLFGPSSLDKLTLDLPYFTANSFDLLETNTCLTTVHISSIAILPLQLLSRILQNNRTIEKLRWGHYSDAFGVLTEVETLNQALSCNTTLKELTLYIHSSYDSEHHLPSLIHDTRVKLTQPSPLPV